VVGHAGIFTRLKPMTVFERVTPEKLEDARE
jgi:hypothetical protein